MTIELPEGWHWSRIKEQFQRVKRKNTAGVSRVLTASGEHGLIDQEEYFNKRVAARDTSNYFHLKRGEFAYNRSSMSGYPYGAVKRLDLYESGALSTLYLCFALRDNAKITSDYATQMFDSNLLNEELQPIVRVGARAHGLLNVTPADFMDVSFPLPPLAEQRKIAAILSSVDDAIAATQAVIEQTRTVKKGLLQELMTRGIGHTEFKKTEVGEIPVGWEAVQLGSVLTLPIKNGYSPVCLDEPTGKWVLGLGALTLEGLDTSRIKAAPVNDSGVDNSRLSSGDILVSRANTRDRVGYSSLFRGEVPNCSYPDLMMRFRVDESRVLPSFIVEFLRSDKALELIQGAAAGTSSSMVKITKRVLGKLPIPIPPTQEQKKISSILNEAQSVVQKNKVNQEALRQLKRGLLQDLLTGKVRVTP